MKNLAVVIRFEFLKLVKKKPFIVSTVVIGILLIIGLSFPTIMKGFGSPIFDKEAGPVGSPEKIDYGILIENDSINLGDLETQLGHHNLHLVDDKGQLKDLVLSQEVVAGFIIEEPTKYEYVVRNTDMHDSNTYIMDHALLSIFRDKTLAEHNIDPTIVREVYSIAAEHEVEILEKDSISNFAYTYILIFGLYFIVIIYGQLIATSIASEKSNRSMEILVTSTSTESLIFGKVIAGALTGILQFVLLILIGKITYGFNAPAWGNRLDFVFDVPGNILATFSIFGILGYLFYLFFYGTVGALVSRTEDVGSAATPLMLVFVASFFVSMFSMQTPDSSLLKVASFIPFSSFMAMFVRVSMGNVATLHVIISLVLLAISTGLMGIFGAKIYRLGTLMYGNPIKLTRAIKLLKDK